MNRVSIAMVCTVMVCAFGRADGERTAGIADSLYQSALALPDSLPVDMHIEAFKRVLKADRKYARAYDQLAKLHLRINSVIDRQNAERAAKEAVRLDRKNLDYKMTLGDVLWAKGFWSEAVDYYKKVLKKYPETAKAAYRVGYFSLNEYMNLKDRKEIRPSSSSMNMRPLDRDRSRDTDNPPSSFRSRVAELMREEPMIISFEPFAKKEVVKSTEYLAKAIAIDPEFRDGYYQMGLLYLEIGRPDELVRIMHKLLERDPHDKDALLFTGLGYLKLRKFARADSCFAQALQHMGPEERSRMENVDLIITDRERTELALDTSGPEQFWKKNDPLLLTGSNERRLEHYARFAYANLRFSRPLRNVEGWRTEMGEVWIKYGRPIRRSTRYSEWGLLETWYYEGFSFLFLSRDGYYGWRSRWSPKSSFKKGGAQRYIDPYQQQKYTLPNQIIAFRDSNRVRVELAYAVPRSKLRFDSHRDFRIADGLFLFDAHWKEVFSKPVDITLPKTASRTRGDHLRDDYFITQHRLYLAPGTYWTVAEVVDRTSLSIGTFRKSVTLAVPDTGLAASDLLLANRITPEVPFPQTRADLSIAPNPLRTYRRTEPVFLYLEVYHLKRNDFGQTHYTIAYQVGPPKKDVDLSLFRAMDLPKAEGQLEVRPIFNAAWTKNMAEQDIPYQVVYKPYAEHEVDHKVSRVARSQMKIASEYEGDRADDFTFLEMDVNELPAGIYNLTVEITDEQTGARIEKETLFRVVE